MRVKLYLPTAEQLIKEQGLAHDGDVQKFHTQNVLRRIKKYVPFVTGATYKLMETQTDINKPKIILEAPYANYIFRGKKMIDPQINASGFMTPEGWRSRRGSVKVLTNEPLNYNRTKNPHAGPRWDKALVAAEGKALVADLQRYIDRRR